MKKRLLLIPLILFLVSGQSFAQVTEEYKENLAEMLRLSLLEDNYAAGIKQWISLHKENYLNVPDEFWEEFEKEFVEKSWLYLLNELAPIYSKYYTLSDLKEIIKFYQSPAGKKMTEHTGSIVQESMVVGREMDEKLKEELNYKLKFNGYK